MQDYCTTNFLQPSGFKIVISKDNYPYLSFLAQSIQHPSMEINATDLGYKRIASVPFVGDAVEFGAVTMDVILDENMNVYGEVYNWMENMLETKHQLNRGILYRSNDTSLGDYNDIRVQILTSSNNPNREFVYRNAFPISLGDIQFNSSTDETFVTCPMTFRFDIFEFL